MQHVIKPEYLYIHIPFCKSICTYCDFIRKIGCSKEIECYVNKIIDELNNKYKDYSFKTIYIGGGTPNSLNDIILDKLLFTCSKLLQQKYEFTIECNPEFVNQKQIDIFKKNKVNRISLGIQSTNNKTLKEIGRKYTIEEAKKAIDLFYLNNINNVSIDFMYGFGNDTTQDIKNDFDFIVNNNIKHYSFYSLELKEGSIMTKQHKKLNDNLIDSLLEKVILLSKQYNYKRYEVSNFAISEQYESLHNKAY
ncbi:hypothetical protein FACS189459_5300 [Bacilli bacterium]|nr:hypothetical protein FACS189459_5300 [Bacilli bacterium]GHU51759.1 hypothetical protein FACS189496_0700 [Bacilli bacterium]